MKKNTSNQKDQNYRKIAISIWVAIAICICAVIAINVSAAIWIPSLPLLLHLGSVSMTIYRILEILWLMIIPSVILYYRANKNLKDKKTLRFRSRILLAISLVILFFAFLLLIWILAAASTPAGGLIAAGGLLWAFLMFAAGFLPFLITSIKLKQLSEQKERTTANGRHKRPARQKKEYTDDSF